MIELKVQYLRLLYKKCYLKEELAEIFRTEFRIRLGVNKPDFAKQFSFLLEKWDDYVIARPDFFSEAFVQEMEAIIEFLFKHRAMAKATNKKQVLVNQTDCEKARVRREFVDSAKCT